MATVSTAHSNANSRVLHGQTAQKPERVLSIDVLRGLTIALMILVNDPGEWVNTYKQLDHSPWNGFTLTDFVFPNFLFLVGFSIILSFSSRIARYGSGLLDNRIRLRLAVQMLRRSATLYAIHLSFSAIPPFHWTRVRLLGVLPRIAVCYLIAGLICLAVWNRANRARILTIITAFVLIAYWILMRYVTVPGVGIPTHAVRILDPDQNLAAWLDRAFLGFTKHYLHTGSLYGRTHDPEGLLSTVPSVATTLIGCIAALYFRRTVPIGERGVVQRSWLTHRVQRFAAGNKVDHTLAGLIFAGVFSIIAGALWDPYFPINKNLWTSSYVLYAGGWSLVLLAFCYWLIDVRRLNQHRAGKWFLWPWLVFGSNAIVAFVFSNYFAELLLHVMLPAGALASRLRHATRISLWGWSYFRLFAIHRSTNNTSLAFAIVFTAICFIPNLLLWRRKIFFKI